MKHAEKTKIIGTHIAKYCLLRGQIIYVKYNQGLEHTLEEAKEHIETIKKITKEIRSPMLIDIRPLKSISREARDYYAGEETAKIQSVCALLIEGPVSRVIGNVYLGMNKPRIPTRLFTNEEKAIAWLENFPD